MRASACVLLLTEPLKLGVVLGATLYPIRERLGHLKRLRTLLSLYSPYDSNLDVAALCLAHTAVVLALLAQARQPRHRGLTGRYALPPPYAKITHGLHWSCALVQLALLAKAVAVAVAGSADLLPPERPAGRAGLLCMFSAIAAALLGSFVEAAAAPALVAARRRAHEAAGGCLAEPLLTTAEVGKNGGKEEEHGSATIGALLSLALPDSLLLLAAFTAGAAAALGQALIPYYTGQIIDYASIDPDVHAFRATTLRLLGVAAACAVATGIRGGLFTVSMTRLNVRLRRQLFRSLMHQEIGFYDTTKTGEITSRLSTDTSTVSDQICLNLNVMLRSATQAAMVLAFMFGASWRLTIVTFVMIPAVLVITKVYGGYYRKMSKKVQTELAEANAVAEESLSSMTTVRAFAAEASSEAAYAAKLRAFHLLQRREAAAYAAYMAANTFLSAAVVAVVLFYGGSLVLGGAMSAGALVSFMLYQQSLSAAFQSLGDVFSALSAAVGAADKVVELMRRQPRLPPAGSLAPPQFAGHIELRDVSFSYPARPAHRVLRGLCLEVAPGEVVALVGPSGGGKSSIVKLVQRFYLPTAGCVLVDGRDVGAYDPRWLRHRVALVSQEPVLYARSIRRNILYGLEEEDGVPPDQVPSHADVEAAARLANAHDFITALPEGYATECGERGVQLSGGQKQRIAIARALVRKPAVLLLDEATSALDADSEAVVQEALDATMRNRTVLVIAHRLSTVQDAHRILVVGGGTVVESGTHESLLAAGGAYASLVRRQLARTGGSAASLGLVTAASEASLVEAAAASAASLGELAG